tara:strand:- start:50 stop:586 length:537 start_codon:yes stop_codon:yes gene_type:complete
MATTRDLLAGARELADAGAHGFDVAEDGTCPGQDAWDAAVLAWVADSGDKFLALRAVRTRLEYEAKMLADEADRLKQASVRAGKGADRLAQLTEALLREHLELQGGDKVSLSDGGWVALRSRKSVSVEVENVDALDPAYIRVKREADKTLIGQELKAGRPVAGAVLVERATESVAWSR